MVFEGTYTSGTYNTGTICYNNSTSSACSDSDWAYWGENGWVRMAGTIHPPKNNKNIFNKVYNNNSIKSYIIERDWVDLTSTGDCWKVTAASGATTTCWDDDYGAYRFEGYYPAGSCSPPPIDPRERLREIIRSRHAPAIHGSRRFVASPADTRELRARETLRMIVGEEKFRAFLKSGFLTVTHPVSGYTYQIFHSTHHLTHVWKDGKCVERLCIYLRGNFPPTDFVITMYLMVLNNEGRVWKVGNRNGALRAPVSAPQRQEKSLAEIYAELKQRAA